MYSSAEVNVSSTNIYAEHLRILEEAVQEAAEFDVRSAEVYQALEYLQARSQRRWGFTAYLEGLERGDHYMMKMGFEQIRHHLGEQQY